MPPWSGPSLSVLKEVSQTRAETSLAGDPSKEHAKLTFVTDSTHPHGLSTFQTIVGNRGYLSWGREGQKMNNLNIKELYL